MIQTINYEINTSLEITEQFIKVKVSSRFHLSATLIIAERVKTPTTFPGVWVVWNTPQAKGAGGGGGTSP